MQAQDFSLPDQNGAVHSLQDYAGKWLVLYFYPKDNTPGCTKEACIFRDERDTISRLGQAEIVGVSKDSVESHKKFAEQQHLNFTLLSDPEHATIEAYGAWGLLGTKRNTVIIDPGGQIAKTYEGVDPKTHAAQIIADLQQLQGRA
jgi:peroxiredoxin Q/BCP